MLARAGVRVILLRAGTGGRHDLRHLRAWCRHSAERQLGVAHDAGLGAGESLEAGQRLYRGGLDLDVAEDREILVERLAHVPQERYSLRIPPFVVLDFGLEPRSRVAIPERNNQ